MVEIADLPRVGHVAGETLLAADLTADLTRAERLRRLHVVAAHQVWGVARGLDVTLAGVEVVVSPGAGYDATGRAIALDSPVRVALPAVPGGGARWCDLLLSGDDRPAGSAGPRLRWSVPAASADGTPPPLGPDVRPGLDLPLGRVAVLAGDPPAAGGQLERSTRRVARGQVRPRVASDQLLPGLVPVAGKAGTWTVQVDTSPAGFAGVPYYVASLGADPLTAVAGGLPVDPRIVGPYTALTGASPAGFTLLVWYGWPDAVPDRPPVLLQELTALPVALSWLGVESVGVGSVGVPAPGRSAP